MISINSLFSGEDVAVTNVSTNGAAPSHILVVDDEDDIRLLLEVYLRRAGYQVSVAPNVPNALEKLEKQNFDMILTDARMPGLTGYDLIKTVRATPAGLAIPIIMITTLSSDEDALLAFRTGVDDFIQKPFNHQVLEAKIANLLKRSSQQTPPTSTVTPISPTIASEPSRPGSVNLAKLLGEQWHVGSNILVTGEFGTGKSTFARQFLAQGLRQNEPTLLVTIDDSPEHVRSELNSILKGQLDTYEQSSNKFRLVDAVSWSTGYGSSLQERFAISGKLELTGLAGAIIDAGTELGQTVNKKAGGRRVIDSISSLFVYFDLATVQRFLLQMARTANSYGGVSTLFLLEEGSVDSHILNNIKYSMDGVFEFRQREQVEMRIANLKWQQNYSKEWFQINYTDLA